MTSDGLSGEGEVSLPIEPKISIIVPVYNVEKYLEKCVKSLLCQSFAEYEIILVDDGSTDGSGILCDRMASQYAQIKVFHKVNGGLSDARNYGLRVCRGRYVTFVDSDDYVSSSYLEFLHRIVVESSACIGACQYKLTFSDSPTPTMISSFSYYDIQGPDALISLLYGRNINVAACGKLYKRELFEGVEFPVGRAFEDVGTTYRLFLEAKRVAVSQAPLYFYRKRTGSITTHPFSESNFDRYLLAKEALENPSLLSSGSRQKAARAYFAHHTLAMLRNVSASKYRTRIKLVRGELSKVAPTVLSDTRAALFDKAALILFLGAGGRVYSKCWRLFESMRGALR